MGTLPVVWWLQQWTLFDKMFVENAPRNSTLKEVHMVLDFSKMAIVVMSGFVGFLIGYSIRIFALANEHVVEFPAFLLTENFLLLTAASAILIVVVIGIVGEFKRWW